MIALSMFDVEQMESLRDALTTKVAPVTMRSLLIETAHRNGLTPGDLQSVSRTHRIAHPRQEFMWRCRQVKNPDGSWRYSLPQIGLFLGGMDHTSVLHGVRQHAKRMAAPKQARAA